MAALTTSTALMTSTDTRPKRVILRLRVNEFEGEGRSWEQHVDAINAYLLGEGRPLSEYESGQHFAYVEPFQAPEVKQTTFHVVLDIEQHLLDKPNLDTVPHEVYRIRRNEDGKLEVRIFKNPVEAQNVVLKTRRFTDVFYPWAGQRRENTQ